MTFARGSNWTIYFFTIVLRTQLYIPDTCPLLDMCFADFPSYSETCLSIPLTVSNRAKMLNLD